MKYAIGQKVHAKMYADRVEFDGEVIGRVVRTARGGLVKVRVERITREDWPYAPKVGQTPYVALSTLS